MCDISMVKCIIFNVYLYTIHDWSAKFITHLYIVCPWKAAKKSLILICLILLLQLLFTNLMSTFNALFSWSIFNYFKVPHFPLLFHKFRNIKWENPWQNVAEANFENTKYFSKYIRWKYIFRILKNHLTIRFIWSILHYEYVIIYS